MSNVLKEEQKTQVIALGQLGWSLRRIQRSTGIRRETISAYLKDAGVDLLRPRGRLLPAKPANGSGQVITDSAASVPDPVDTEAPAEPIRSPSASACELYRDASEADLTRGRNARKPFGRVWSTAITSLRCRISERSLLHPQDPRQPCTGSVRHYRDRSKAKIMVEPVPNCGGSSKKAGFRINESLYAECNVPIPLFWCVDKLRSTISSNKGVI